MGYKTLKISYYNRADNKIIPMFDIYFRKYYLCPDENIIKTTQNNGKRTRVLTEYERIKYGHIISRIKE